MPSLEDLYKEVILDHYKNPRNQGTLEPPAIETEGHNPLCGDEITLYTMVNGGVITDVAIKSSGCSISQSSASMMTNAVKGKTITEATQLIEDVKSMLQIHLDESDTTDAKPKSLGDIDALKGVVQFPVRIKCATLSWNTLAQAIEEAANS